MGDDVAARQQEEWVAGRVRRLESAYLEAVDPRGGSGFRGDEARWERARRVVLTAVDRDGTLLDVGCANGLLLESLVAWAAEDGLVLEPFGLEVSAALASRARARLPQWADRIATGDVTAWQPPRRFDYVRIELVYAPPQGRAALVRRCLDEFVASGGRLIVCSYGSTRRAGSPRPGPGVEQVGDLLRRWGHEVAGEAEAADLDGTAVTRIAWLDRPTVGCRATGG